MTSKELERTEGKELAAIRKIAAVALSASEWLDAPGELTDALSDIEDICDHAARSATAEK